MLRRLRAMMKHSSRTYQYMLVTITCVSVACACAMHIMSHHFVIVWGNKPEFYFAHGRVRVLSEGTPSPSAWVPLIARIEDLDGDTDWIKERPFIGTRYVPMAGGESLVEWYLPIITIPLVFGLGAIAVASILLIFQRRGGSK